MPGNIGLYDPLQLISNKETIQHIQPSLKYDQKNSHYVQILRLFVRSTGIRRGTGLLQMYGGHQSVGPTGTARGNDIITPPSFTINNPLFWNKCNVRGMCTAIDCQSLCSCLCSDEL